MFRRALFISFTLLITACAAPAEPDPAIQQAQTELAHVQATATAVQQNLTAAHATAQAAAAQTSQLTQQLAQNQAALATSQAQLTTLQVAIAATTAAQPTDTPIPPTPTIQPTITYDPTIYGHLNDIDLAGATVVFWHQHTGSSAEALQAIVGEFNATNEWGITVEARHEGTYGDIYSKMITALASGGQPGLLVAYQNQAAAYQTLNGLVNLEPYLHHPTYGLSEADRADFFAPFLASDQLPQFDHKMYGFPPNRSMELMYYNADWLAELRAAGAIDFDGPPQTPDQFAAAACAAKATPFSRNPNPAASMGYQVRLDASQIAALAFAVGEDIYDAATNQFTYHQPGLTSYLTRMATLLNDGCAGRIGQRFGDQEDFANGSVLFTMGSSAGLPFYRTAVNQGADFAWSVAPVPHTTPQPTMNIYGASVSIPQTDPQTQLAAWLFIRYYTATNIQARWAKASNYFPVRATAANGLTDYFAAEPAYQTAFALLPFAKTEPGVAGYDAIRDAASEAYHRILTGENADAVLAELDATANQLLADSAP